MIKRRKFITLLGGAAVAWPLAARAQQAARQVRVGLLSTAGTFSNSVFEAFHQEMRRLGYADTRVAYEFRSAGGDFTRLPTLASELAGMPIDVILTDGTPAARAAKEATTQVPIVMATVGDPIASGIVDNLARPGGNITGFTLLSLELSSKRLELLKEIVPAVRRVGVLWTPVNSPLQFAATQAAARVLDIAIESGEVQNPDAIAGGIDSLAGRGATALVVLPDALFWNQRKTVLARAAAHRLAAIYPEREYVDDGGLIAYGPNVAENFRRAAGYVDRILKGVKPADLPVQQPTKFELIISMKSAKAIGLSIPPALPLRADEVIE
jgi:putative tryptophan/tyrosine transport system substrate-binding protein